MDFRDILILVNVTATDNVYPTLIQYAREHGWRLTIEDRMAPPKGWRGDGAIVQAMDWPVISQYVKSLTKRGIPVVNLVNSKVGHSLPSCLVDIRKSAEAAAVHFLDRGFSHAVYFAMEWLSSRNESFASFAKAMRGCDVQKWAWPDETRGHRVNDRAAMTKWLLGRLRGAERPLAVLCPNPYNAVTFMNVCLDAGIAVPDEVAVMCDSYDPAFCECQVVPITGIEYDTRRQALEGAALLDRLIDGDKVGPTRIVIPPTRIVVQRSTDVIATKNELLRRALRFIRENIGRPFGAAEIAASLEVPRIRLDRLFATELRRSVGKEILRQRIAKAKQLLAETDDTLDAVASSCGFCHASYLINAFKKATGTTPHHYRRDTRESGFRTADCREGP